MCRGRINPRDILCSIINEKDHPVQFLRRWNYPCQFLLPQRWEFPISLLMKIQINSRGFCSCFVFVEAVDASRNFFFPIGSVGYANGGLRNLPSLIQQAVAYISRNGRQLQDNSAIVPNIDWCGQVIKMKRVIIYDFGRGGKVSTFIEKLYVSIFFFLSFLFSRTRDFFTGNFFLLG